MRGDKNIKREVYAICDVMKVLLVSKVDWKVVEPELPWNCFGS